MAPTDPGLIADVKRSVDSWKMDCTVTVPGRAPHSGGIAFRVARGSGVFWLQAKRGGRHRYGITFVVRDRCGRDIGPIANHRGENPVSCAVEHLMLAMQRPTPIDEHLQKFFAAKVDQ